MHGIFKMVELLLRGAGPRGTGGSLLSGCGGCGDAPKVGVPENDPPTVYLNLAVYPLPLRVLDCDNTIGARPGPVRCTRRTGDIQFGHERHIFGAEGRGFGGLRRVGGAVYFSSASSLPHG